MTNKLALAATSIGNVTPVEFVQAAAGGGFDGVGLRVYRSPGLQYAFTPLAGYPERVRELRSALQASGLEVWEVLSFYLQPEMDFDGIAAALDVAAELGGRYPLVIGDDTDWSRMCASMARFCDLAQPRGLVPAVEAPVYSRVVNTLPMAVQLIEEAAPGRAVLGLDPFMFHRKGHTLDLLRDLNPGLFPYSQLGDGTREPPERCAPGDGEVPLDGMLDLLPPDVPLSLEWSAPRGSDYSAAAWAQHAGTATRAFLERHVQRSQ